MRTSRTNWNMSTSFADSAYAWRNLTLYRPQAYPRNRTNVSINRTRRSSTNFEAVGLLA
jgi:hypothetical protein